MKHRMAFGAAAIAAVASMPAFAGNLVTNGGFENNFGAGQFNQTLPGSAGGQNANHPGTTADGWTVAGTNANFPDGYAFIFKNNNSFTMSNGHVGPASESANPSGSNILPLWGNSRDGSPDGDYFYGVDSTYHPSALTQEIDGLVVGHTYTLTFDFAAAQQFDYDGNTIDDWVVTLGGQTIATTNIKLPSHGFSGWFADSVTFTYDGGGQNPGLLSFVNLGMGGSTVCLAPITCPKHGPNATESMSRCPTRLPVNSSIHSRHLGHCPRPITVGLHSDHTGHRLSVLRPYPPDFTCCRAASDPDNGPSACVNVASRVFIETVE